MTPRVVCDTNVLVSALIADGPPSRVLEVAIDGRVELMLPRVVVEELERVLVEKLGFDVDYVDRARRLLESITSVHALRPTRVPSVTGETSDDTILAFAVQAGADVLVTGDKKHLLPLGEHRGVGILTPQAFLAQLRLES